MRRTRKIALWTVGILLGVPIVLVLALLAAANTAPGQRLIEQEAASLTGGTVRLTGLSGTFPQALRLARLELHDARGTWLTATDIALDWSPLALLGLTADIDDLSIQHLDLPRLPAPAAPAATPAPSGGTSLPVAVRLRQLRLARATIGAPIAGLPATLRLTGSADIPSLQQGRAELAIDRLDSPGTYRLEASLAADGAIAATLHAAEPPHGLIGEAAHLPEIGALSIAARVEGPRAAERTDLDAAAGALRAALHGTIDIPGKRGALDLVATAPAMHPAPDLAWQAIDLRAHAAGPWTAPDATAHLVLSGLAASGAEIGQLTADLAGNRGHADLTARIAVTRLPGPKPDLLAAAPLDLTAHAELADAARPVTFRLTHPLLTAEGTAATASPQRLHLHLIAPDLAPLAAAGQVDLRGAADLGLDATHGAATTLALAGTVNVTGGAAPLPALLGPARIAARAELAGPRITLQTLTLDGRALNATLSGEKSSTLSATFDIALRDLAALSPQARGQLRLRGAAHGTAEDLALNATLSGEAGSTAVPRGPVSATLAATGLPRAPRAHLTADARLDGAPLRLVLNAARDAQGALRVTLTDTRWKSLTASADLTLPKGATLPLGRIEARAPRLADLAPLTGQSLSGGLTAAIVTAGTGAAPVTRIDVQGTGLGAAGSRVARLAITGTVTGADQDPDLDIALTAQGVESGTITGAARATAKGRANALALTAGADLAGIANGTVTARTTAVLDAKAKQLRLATLTADAHGIPVRLAAPARIDFGAQTAVDRLRLLVGAATLELAGRLAPTLDASAALRNVTPDLAKPFAPQLDAAGVLNASARLTGTTAAPAGSVRLAATGLRLRHGPAAAVPPAAITANVTLGGGRAALAARIDAGPKLHLAASGTAPLAAQGALDLRTTGAFDLTLLDPVLTAEGRRAQGRAAIDLRITGTPAKPDPAGSITLARGDVQDYVQGLHITDIDARIDAAGGTFTITRFTGRAGPGTLALAGSVGTAAPMPVDLRLTARNARPLASDLLTTTLDADLRVHGAAQATLDAGGTVMLRHTDINIPDSLPPSVAVLQVRRAGQAPPPPPPPAPPSIIRLAIDLDAPRAVFVRGHGLDAELGGTIHVRGTSTAPDISGGFEMRRGEFSLAGTTLEFSKGEVSFNGAGVTGKIDPTLNFEADSSQGGITATLKITGYADAPKIALSSVPDLPQDEVLAHLLFGQSMASLSPLQIAEIGAALAEISGLTGGGEGPLGSIRKGLGLDRLSIGGGTNGAGASIQAGRYVAPGVYVGAKQATSGAGGTQAQVQVDITRHLKLLSQLGTGGSTQGATPENDPGSSIGLSYQFEY